MISLHAPTLSAMLTAVTGMTGLLLLISWLQNRGVRALLWWSCSNFAGGLGTALYVMRGVAPEMLTVVLANALIILAFSAAWAGFRLFCNRPLYPLAAFGPPLGVALLYQWAPFYDSMQWRIGVVSVLPAAYSTAIAVDLWRLRGERLVSRYPAIGWALLHAAFFGARAPIAFFVQTPPSEIITLSPWFSVVTFEALLNVIAMGFLQIAMIRERAENYQRAAARTDLLTGAPNRRALMNDGERILAQAEEAGQPVCCLLMDIDHFKTINDRFGHAGGDAALIGVAAAMREHLRAGDMFARLGGEEFACLLPNTSVAVGTMVAEGLRARIAGLKLDAVDRDLRISISVGVACAPNAGGASVSLDALLREADRNLYEAKAAGRNRVSATKERLGPERRVA